MSSLRPHRTDEEWLAALAGPVPVDEDAVADLRGLLRGGLARAIGGRNDVNDADLDDFAQDAAIRVLSRLGSFRGESRFTTWATAIAIRVAYTAMRRREWSARATAKLGHDANLNVEPAVAPVEPGLRTDLLGALQDAISRDLTARQRAAVLGELTGMPPGLLAEELGTNTNALYKLYHDARKRLRNSLEKRGFSGPEVRNILEGASKA